MIGAPAHGSSPSTTPNCFVVAVAGLGASAVPRRLHVKHAAHPRVRVADPSIKNGGFKGIKADCKDARATTKAFGGAPREFDVAHPQKSSCSCIISSAPILSTLRS